MGRLIYPFPPLEFVVGQKLFSWCSSPRHRTFGVFLTSFLTFHGKNISRFPVLCFFFFFSSLPFVFSTRPSFSDVKCDDDVSWLMLTSPRPPSNVFFFPPILTRQLYCPSVHQTSFAPFFSAASFAVFPFPLLLYLSQSESFALRSPGPIFTIGSAFRFFLDFCNHLSFFFFFCIYPPSFFFYSPFF